MSLTEKLRTWFELPVMQVPTYQCTECGLRASPEHSECPECGGHIESMGEETIPIYWQ